MDLLFSEILRGWSAADSRAVAANAVGGIICIAIVAAMRRAYRLISNRAIDREQLAALPPATDAANQIDTRVTRTQMKMLVHMFDKERTLTIDVSSGERPTWWLCAHSCSMREKVDLALRVLQQLSFKGLVIETKQPLWSGRGTRHSFVLSDSGIAVVLSRSTGVRLQALVESLWNEWGWIVLLFFLWLLIASSLRLN